MPNTEIKPVATVTITVPITHELVNDILTDAFETAIGYWAKYSPVGDFTTHKSLDYHDGIYWYADRDLNFRYTLYDAETGERFSHVGYPNYQDLTFSSLIKGIQLWLNSPNRTGSLEDMDAEIADTIVQYAVFGDIVFG